jgi:hypothetical protein
MRFVIGDEDSRSHACNDRRVGPWAKPRCGSTARSGTQFQAHLDYPALAFEAGM